MSQNITEADMLNKFKQIPQGLDADALVKQTNPLLRDMILGNVDPIVCNSVLEQAAGHLKIKKSLLFKQFTAVQKSLKQQLVAADPAVEKADLFVKTYIVWATATFAEKGDRPIFYVAVYDPQSHWEERSEQALLVMAGLDAEADRAFNNRFLYALSLRAQVQGPPTEASSVNSKMMNLRNGVYDANTGTMEPWAPEMKLLGALRCAYLHQKDPLRIPVHKNRLHKFLKRYGSDVYHRLVYWVFPRVFLPGPGGSFICLIGLPGCGKTTLMEQVVGRIVGPPARITLEQIEKNSHEMITWLETYWNFFDEMSSGGLKGCEIIKLIATQTMITIDPKFRALMTVRCVTTAVFGANQMMWIPDVDGAIFDRLLIVYFTKRFRDTGTEIENLGAFLDTIPQDHWDSFFSDILDIALEGKNMKPPRGAMEQQYKLLRDRLFIFMTTTIRDAPGNTLRVSAIPTAYMEEHRRIEKCAERNHKTIEPEPRMSGSLYDATMQYCRFLGLDLYQDSHDKCWYVRGVDFRSEDSSATSIPQIPIEFPKNFSFSGFSKKKLSAQMRSLKPLKYQGILPSLRITPALLSILSREEKNKKRRKNIFSSNRKDSAESAGPVRHTTEKHCEINDLQPLSSADDQVQFAIALVQSPTFSGSSPRVDSWPYCHVDLVRHVQRCTARLTQFCRELLARLQQEKCVHLRQCRNLIPEDLRGHLPHLIMQLERQGLLRWEAPMCVWIESPEVVDNRQLCNRPEGQGVLS